MRKAYDSTNPDNVPLDADFYWFYVDGYYVPKPGQLSRFPINKIQGIAVFETTNAGLIGDMEFQDMTPDGLCRWVQMRRLNGVWASGYCSLDNWGDARAAFAKAGVLEPPWIVAAYPGIGPNLYPGVIGHQYEDTGGYDISVIADYWPGVDGPHPSPPVDIGDNMQQQEVALVTADNAGIVEGFIPSPVPVAKIIKAKVVAPNPDEKSYYGVPQWTYESTDPGPNSPNGSLVFQGGAAGQYAVDLIWQT